ncbi:MAG: hypothetical protein R3B57_08230 [Phycisphaerales bacterium]
MNLIRATAFGLVAAIVCAAVWAAISYFLHFEIGWIAWGIGFVVGIATLGGAGGKGGPAVAGLAVFISILSIAGGKYADVHFAVAKYMRENGMTAEAPDELLHAYLADEIVSEHADAGEELAWPEGVNPAEAISEKDYPPGVWGEAVARWEAMSEDEHGAYRDRIESQRQSQLDTMAADIRTQAFKDSFSLWDLLWFGLAVATAFKIGMSNAEPARGAPAAPGA